MSDSDDLLDIKQAARFLHVSETSLRRWTNEGRLACLRVGHRRERRFRRDDLRAFMEDQPVAPPAGARRTAPLEAPQTVIGGIPLAHGTHLAGFYSSSQERVKLAAAFLADGLRPGTVSYLVSTPGARQEIVTCLQQGRPELQVEIDAGRFVLSEYAATPTDQYAYFERSFLGASRDGAVALRLVGDVSGGRFVSGRSIEDVIDYEMGYERCIARRFPVVTLCLYDARRYSALEALGVFKCHGDDFRYPAERLLA